MNDLEIMRIGRRLLRPYDIPVSCPYLSEDQHELSALDFKGRSEWMGEWLRLAAAHGARNGKGLPRRRARSRS